MKRRGNVWLVAAAIVLAVNLLVGYRVYSQEARENGEGQAFEKISVMMHVLQLIRQDYVDADQVAEREQAAAEAAAELSGESVEELRKQMLAAAEALDFEAAAALRDKIYALEQAALGLA